MPGRERERRGIDNSQRQGARLHGVQVPHDRPAHTLLERLSLALQHVLEHGGVHAVVDLERLERLVRRRLVVDLARALGAAQQLMCLYRREIEGGTGS